MSKMTTAEAIVEMLIKYEVDTVFGLPGAQTYDLMDALYNVQDKIKFITVRHEQAAAYMAFGYARSTGKAGVFTVVPGPGVLNTMAALCTALGCNTPVLCLTAQVPSDFLGKGRGHLHELPDQLATLRSLLKWADRIDDPSQTATKVQEAFTQMLSGRQGPVSIEVPWDVMGQEGEINLPNVVNLPSPDSPDRSQLSAAAEMIAQSKRPMIYVGGGALHASEEVTALAEKLCAPVGSFRAGRGVVAEDHPLGFSLPVAHEVWPETDLLIGIGSRLEGPYMRWNLMQWVERPASPPLIRIDIDAEEFNRFPADAGIEGDAKIVTRALLELLDGMTLHCEDRAERFKDIKEETWASFDKVQPQVSYLKAIRDVLPRDGFFVEELTQVGFTSNFAFPVLEPRTYVTCGYQGTLGFGFPTALGVKVAHPEKAVVSVIGDGGFMFGVQDLATAAQFDIGLITIVFNNHYFGNVRRDQENRFGGRIMGAELQNPDFCTMAKTFGVDGYQTDSPDGLLDILQSALDLDRPALIEVLVDGSSESSPWEFIHPVKKETVLF